MDRGNEHQLPTLSDLFVEQLHQMFDAEQRLAETLPKMQQAATAPELKAAFGHHRDDTQTQVNRLEQAFTILDADSHARSCEAMKGLIREVSRVLSAGGESSVRDAALLATAQRIAHYEIASYGTLRNLAARCGHGDLANLFQQSLNEEKKADQKFTQIADQSINVRATRM